MTKLKIAKGYYSNKHSQKDIAEKIGCHKNTINKIIKLCRERGPDDEIWRYLKEKVLISEDELNSVFSFLKAKSKRPNKSQYNGPLCQHRIGFIKSLDKPRGYLS